MIPHFLRCIIYHSRYQLNGPELMRVRLDHFYTNNTRTVVKLIIMAEVINHQRTLVPLSLFLAGGLSIDFALCISSSQPLRYPLVHHRSPLTSAVYGCGPAYNRSSNDSRLQCTAVQLCRCSNRSRSFLFSRVY